MVDTGNLPIIDDADWHQAPLIDTTRAHTARTWNYWLGGKDHFAIDRAVGDQIRRLHPGIVDGARADRAFLVRAVTYLTAAVGIRQFLDIGAGLPTVDNTHEVAQRIAPESRIVYVDNDPLVLVHARALLTGVPQGATDCVDADLRDVAAILDRSARTLDPTRPVGLLLLGVLDFIDGDDEAQRIVRRLLDALPAGSHLVLSHTATDPSTSEIDAAVAHWNRNGTPGLTPRTPGRITRFFDGLDLLEPGAVPCSQWRSEPSRWGRPGPVAMLGGVGRKP